MLLRLQLGIDRTSLAPAFARELDGPDGDVLAGVTETCAARPSFAEVIRLDDEHLI
jgi:hypothetical protein